MIFSVHNRCKSRAAAGEIQCASNQLGSIFEFAKQHPEKRYNILLKSDQPIEQALAQIDLLRAIVDSYTVECDQLSTVKVLINKGYNAYYGYWVSDWELFTNLQKLGVSDIRVDGPLGFQTKLLAKAKKNTKIRCYPHYSASASFMPPAANHFFVRPEDISLYEEAIDIFDLREPDPERQETLFNIYSRGTFNYNIDLLIYNIPSDVNNLVLKDFAEPRLNCKQRCKQPDSHCDLCNSKFHYVDIVTQYGKNRLS